MEKTSDDDPMDESSSDDPSENADQDDEHDSSPDYEPDFDDLEAGIAEDFADEECIICRMPYNESEEVPIRLPGCAHIIGHLCFDKWYRVNRQNPGHHLNQQKCPHCRGQLRQDRVVTLMKQELEVIWDILPQEGLAHEERVGVAFSRYRKKCGGRATVSEKTMDVLAELSHQHLDPALDSAFEEHPNSDQFKRTVRRQVLAELGGVEEHLQHFVDVNVAIPDQGTETCFVSGQQVLPLDEPEQPRYKVEALV